MRVLLRDRQLEGRIVASMAGSLWLDPLVERRMMDGIKVLNVVLNVRQQLMHKDLADNNPSVSQDSGFICSSISLALALVFHTLSSFLCPGFSVCMSEHLSESS